MPSASLLTQPVICGLTQGFRGTTYASVDPGDDGVVQDHLLGPRHSAGPLGGVWLVVGGPPSAGRRRLCFLGSP